MRYRTFDLFILKKIYEKATSTWKMGQEWKWEDKPIKFNNKKEEEDYWKSKCDKIIKRLRLMEKEGIILIEKNSHNKNIYNLISENIVIKKLKFPDNKIRKTMFIKEKNRNWISFQL